MHKPKHQSCNAALSFFPGAFLQHPDLLKLLLLHDVGSPLYITEIIHATCLLLETLFSLFFVFPLLITQYIQSNSIFLTSRMQTFSISEVAAGTSLHFHCIHRKICDLGTIAKHSYQVSGNIIGLTPAHKRDWKIGMRREQPSGQGEPFQSLYESL